MRQFLLTNLVKEQNKFNWRLNLNALEKAFDSKIIEFPVIKTVFSKPTLFIGGTRSCYLRYTNLFLKNYSVVNACFMLNILKYHNNNIT